jgi:hypothetical protein
MAGAGVHGHKEMEPADEGAVGRWELKVANVGERPTLRGGGRWRRRLVVNG